ncbi:MAG: hypothetical protein ILNGONEN_01268 [Syntrophorhabdaceae bacterium]|nr:hypothetical protein [Syntrophorhabdaceae bacterium]
MVRPTLVIGVGTSGLKIVENVQKYMYEALGMNSLPIFKYLYIETDGGRDIEPTPLGSDIIPLRAYVPKLQSAIDMLQNNSNLELDWIPDGLGAQLASINAGAGGVRPGGRLALWADQNFENVYRQIEKAYKDAVDPATLAKVSSQIRQRAGGINPTPVVYVVGTLCGGTNAGMGTIDIGYIIRKVTGMQDGGALYAIFLVPPDGLKMPMGYGNAYGALKEIEFFRDPDHDYIELWPNGVRGDSSLTPYGIVYLVSQEYYDERLGGISSLDGLYRTVGLQVFVNLLGMSDLRTSVLVDGLNQGFGFYSTFGISALTHPRYALSEYNACHAAMNLCERWLNQAHYIDAGGARSQINEPVARDQAAEYMDRLLESAIALLERRMERVALIDEIKEDIDKILTKQIESVERYLHGKFNSGSADGYFAIVRGNLRAVRDHVIEELERRAVEELDKKQNLRMLELFLQGCQSRLQKTLDLWSVMDIPKDTGKWNVYADGVIADIMIRPNTALLHKRNTLIDRLRNLLNDLKTFCMRETLQELLTALEAGAAVSSRNSSVYLPTLTKTKNLRQAAETLKQNLEERRNRIFAEMNDTTVPIFRVWRGGSFEEDSESSFNLFCQQKGNDRYAGEVITNPLFKFLDCDDDEKIATAAEELKRGYQKETIGAIPDIDLLHEAENRVDDVRNYAARAQSGLLRLKHVGTSGAGVPRFVISSSTQTSKQLIDGLGKTGFGGYLPQQAAIDFLKHMIIFYEEKAQVEPLQDLQIIETLERNFKEAPTNPSGAKIMPDDLWRKMRMAYSIERRAEQLKAKNRLSWVGNILNLLLDFAIVSEPDAITGDLEPTHIRHEFQTLNIALQPGKVPRYDISVSGKQTLYLLLKNDDGDDKKNLARETAHFDSFFKSVKNCVKAAGKERMLAIWKDDVSPLILNIEKGGIETANEKGQFYFGSSGKPGFIDRLIAEK